MKNNNDSISSRKIISKPLINNGPNSKILRDYKMSLKNLSDIQWEASIGLMLGDASLQT